MSWSEIRTRYVRNTLLCGDAQRKHVPVWRRHVRNTFLCGDVRNYTFLCERCVVFGVGVGFGWTLPTETNLVD